MLVLSFSILSPLVFSPSLSLLLKTTSSKHAKQSSKQSSTSICIRDEVKLKNSSPQSHDDLNNTSASSPTNFSMW